MPAFCSIQKTFHEAQRQVPSSPSGVGQSVEGVLGGLEVAMAPDS